MNLAEGMQPQEQVRYARWLDAGSRIGLVLLVLAFLGYAAGLTSPHVQVQRLPQVWGLPVGDFLQATGTPTGWGWLALAAHGDLSNLIGIALLAGCSLPALLALLPLYARRGDHAYLALCVAEVGVIVFAASGVVGAGH